MEAGISICSIQTYGIMNFLLDFKKLLVLYNGYYILIGIKFALNSIVTKANSYVIKKIQVSTDM